MKPGKPISTTDNLHQDCGISDSIHYWRRLIIINPKRILGTARDARLRATSSRYYSTYLLLLGFVLDEEINAL